jgi:hypothetical protein
MTMSKRKRKQRPPDDKKVNPFIGFAQCPACNKTCGVVHVKDDQFRLYDIAPRKDSLRDVTGEKEREQGLYKYKITYDPHDCHMKVAHDA